MDVNGNMNTAIVDILDALLTIKYSPPSDVSPITFREGISTVILFNIQGVSV